MGDGHSTHSATPSDPGCCWDVKQQTNKHVEPAGCPEGVSGFLWALLDSSNALETTWPLSAETMPHLQGITWEIGR